MVHWELAWYIPIFGGRRETNCHLVPHLLPNHGDSQRAIIIYDPHPSQTSQRSVAAGPGAPAADDARCAFRSFAHGLLKLVAKICLKVTVEGMENFPAQGPALIVINHLGDADTPALISALPVTPDALGKIELYDFPVLGKLMDWYGVIWLHRGRADKKGFIGNWRGTSPYLVVAVRQTAILSHICYPTTAIPREPKKALRAALDGFAEGRIIIIAPEGRYSLTGALEEGSGGAAFLAYKSGAPILPITVTGTENENVYGQMKKLRRAAVYVRVGKMFQLEGQAKGRHDALELGTHQIMQALANLLPENYRGAYQKE